MKISNAARYALAAALISSVSAPLALAQSYKAALPAKLATGNLALFTRSDNGLDYSASGTADLPKVIAATTQAICTRDRYLSLYDLHGIRYWAFDSRATDVLCHDNFFGDRFEELYSNRREVVVKPAVHVVASTPLKHLDEAQFGCLSSQTGALNKFLADAARLDFAKSTMKLSKVELSLEDNSKAAKADKQLTYGPDLKTPGTLKLRVVLTSKGECLFTSPEQLAVDFDVWKLNADLHKLATEPGPSTEDAAAPKTVLAGEPSGTSDNKQGAGKTRLP
ncbi:MAG: hypothetical protein HY075_03590 [Deltaproteobacteria bacterium]|nr:hypothetical protein [Deltaproteobacteria bacterium]